MLFSNWPLPYCVSCVDDIMSSVGEVMNILVADDELYRLESLERGLKFIGHEVRPASNAIEVIACLGSDHAPLDLIITDCTTSFMGHSEIIRILEQRRGKIPILMVTDLKTANHGSHPLWPWCEQLIEKPFELDQLVHLIERIQKSALNR
jgi:two-component system, NtrC family, nitrogen regulation response regulator NtrX